MKNYFRKSMHSIFLDKESYVQKIKKHGDSQNNLSYRTIEDKGVPLGRKLETNSSFGGVCEYSAWWEDLGNNGWN